VVFVAQASNDSNNAAQSIETLRAVIEARDAENKLLKLMIAKLQMQLANLTVSQAKPCVCAQAARTSGQRLEQGSGDKQPQSRDGR